MHIRGHTDRHTHGVTQQLKILTDQVEWPPKSFHSNVSCRKDISISPYMKALQKLTRANGRQIYSIILIVFENLQMIPLWLFTTPSQWA